MLAVRPMASSVEERDLEKTHKVMDSNDVMR